MSKLESINKLSNQSFRRLTGVHKATFEEMKKILEAAEQQEKHRGGKPNKLTIPERLLMSLEYLREYRTYFHLGQSYGLSESACYRNCRWVEDRLIKSKQFNLSETAVSERFIYTYIDT
ncbi:MAG TPA: transposase family protein [Hanamia sp.]